MTDRSPWVVLGRVSGLYGVCGWVRISSHTAPRNALVDYRPLFLRHDGGWTEHALEAGKTHGRGLIGKFSGVDDRDAAARLVGRDIAVTRGQLPPPADGEYYWTDLEGLSVTTLDGATLGTVDHLFATGANDVMVVRGERERLIPFVRPRYVTEVDLAARRITVDWDADF